jgi:integrase
VIAGFEQRNSARYAPRASSAVIGKPTSSSVAKVSVTVLVPLPPALLRRLERYIKDSRPADTRSNQLFLGLRRGRSGDYEPLTPSGVLQLVTRTTDRAGITKRVYTHLLRHSFITNALRAGMSPILVAKVAGHSSLRMIERTYSHLTTDDAYNAMVEMLAHREGR